MQPEKKNDKYHISLPVILAIGIAAGILIGATFSEKPRSANNLSDAVRKFREVVTLIDQNYVDEVNVDELTEDAIRHMLSELDPHSTYIPLAERQRANEDLKGNFEGIGIEFNIFNDTIVVVNPLIGGPSEKAGLRTGDRIVKIDGKNVAGVGFTNEDVRDHLKGPKNTLVNVTVQRKDGEFDYEIERDKIPQSSVDAFYMIDNEIGYMKISRFSATTYDEFKVALASLKDMGMSKLVLDLQGNPGGYMNRAVAIADEFLPSDQKIVYTKGKQKRYDEEEYASREGLFEEGDLIVLVNEGSASASEIVSGALQDNDRALIVGRRSFGKGLVQAPIDLSDGSELRLTISRYYTPSGRSIQKPYTNSESYAKDLLARYEGGEFFSADSINFNDSLKYETRTGRSVYGGGGIMPDYFVPLDTTNTSTYLNALYANNVVQEFTFEYVAGKKEDLKEKGYEQFRKNFRVTNVMLDNLVKMGESNGVKADLADLQKHRDLFKLQVKAQIARQVWDYQGFYPIFNEINEILQQAVKLFDQAEKLDRSKL